MRTSPIANRSDNKVAITQLCESVETGQLTWCQAHDVLVDLNVRIVSSYLDLESRDDLAAFLGKMLSETLTDVERAHGK